MKQRLDHLLVEKGLVETRSQAESYIRLGEVRVEDKVIKKPGYFVAEETEVTLGVKTQYVSRAALKLASVVNIFHLDFKNKIVLDVGSSTGGFTDYALQHGAKKVLSVDVGTNQLHPKLRKDSRVELHEKTDIRDFQTKEKIDIVVIDVSFISMKLILNYVAKIAPNSQIIAMCKPQFEAEREQLNKGIVKNQKIRRIIVHQMEDWLKSNNFLIQNKADSAVSGEKGNIERFYKLLKIADKQ